jgi:lipopolysaccharide transport system ATP-binding protein
MSTVIKVENLSKQYRLGLVGATTFKEDSKRWWAKMRGKEDPYLNIGVENDRTIKDNSKFVWSLRDINFDVQQGDVLGVIGRNGAGKSTLLKILSKVTAPTIGSVKVKGRIASLLEVGTGFHPELTGRENIYLNGAILGMRKHEITRKIDEIIAFSGVEKYVDTPVKRYSSGMYVRLAFAVAAHLESEVLIIDEVLAVGDIEFQKKCLGKMGDVSRGEGRTILFVSHNIPAVKTLCKSAILLENGRLSLNSNVDMVLKKYASSYSIENRFLNLEFENYENEFLKIIFASVYSNENKKNNTLITLDDDITLKFEILNKTKENFLSIGFDIKTVRDEIVFGSGSVFEFIDNKIIVTCKIPKNFLNSDIYNLDFYIHTKMMKQLCYFQNMLTFEIHEIERENGYLGKINGFIRCQLEWSKIL